MDRPARLRAVGLGHGWANERGSGPAGPCRSKPEQVGGAIDQSKRNLPLGALAGAGALLACAATLLALAGCGSSGSGGSSTTTDTSTSAAASTQTSSSAAHSELKADAAPKYASPSPSEQAKSGTIEIAYRNLAIDPDTVRAKVGSTVKWTNEDPQKCNVTSEHGPYKFSSGDIQEGATYELKLDRKGTINYECTYYPVTMNGTIEVVG